MSAAAVWQLNQSPLNDCSTTVVYTRYYYYYYYRLLFLQANVKCIVNYNTRYKLDQGEKGVKIAAAAGIIYRQLIFFSAFLFFPSRLRPRSDVYPVVCEFYYYYTIISRPTLSLSSTRAVALFGGRRAQKHASRFINVSSNP